MTIKRKRWDERPDQPANVGMSRHCTNAPAPQDLIADTLVLQDPVFDGIVSKDPIADDFVSQDPTTDELLLLDNQLCFSAYALSREITGLYRPLLDQLGITYTQYITLMVLWESGELTMKALGERLFLDSGTLTPLLKKLSRMRLVEKERDSADERSVIVRLTHEGWKMRDHVAGIPMKILCGTGLELDSAVELRERLRQLTREIKKMNT